VAVRDIRFFRRVGNDLRIQEDDQPFPYHTAEFGQHLADAVFAVDQRNHHRFVVGDPEQALMVDFHPAAEPHHSGNGGGAGQAHLARPADDRFVQGYGTP